MTRTFVNIAIFPAEGENAFELYRSLCCSPRFTVYGASSRAGHGSFIFERYTDSLPSINEGNFIPAFNEYLDKYNIHLIFPSHDTVVLFLKEHEALLHARIVGSGIAAVRLCRDKRLLYQTFQQESFCPAVFANIAAVTNFPVFLKPPDGQGGHKCTLAANREEAVLALAHDPALLVCEYLPGTEYTLDCFTDRHGTLLFTGPRSRDVIRMGIAFQSSSVPLSTEMGHIAALLNNRMKMRGLWYFQLKADAVGRLKLLEVSARMACSMGLYRQLGVNFALLAAYDALDMNVRILKNNMDIRLSRSLHTSYQMKLTYDTVYVDLDDTLIVRGMVNLMLIAFLYQCINEGKKIILLTRHVGDPLTCLEQHKIHPAMFNNIIHIDDETRKSSCIYEKNAVFIDNLFIEREEVKTRLGIPVFDIDAVEALINGGAMQ
jgi:hypothetical protein